MSMAGEFSVMYTSAGEASPSWTIWLARKKSDAERMATLTPVWLVKSAAQASASGTCWELYRFRVTSDCALIGFTSTVDSVATATDAPASIVRKVRRVCSRRIAHPPGVIYGYLL